MTTTAITAEPFFTLLVGGLHFSLFRNWPNQWREIGKLLRHLPTYPGVPQAVAMASVPSILLKPKSLIINRDFSVSLKVSNSVFLKKLTAKNIKNGVSMSGLTTCNKWSLSKYCNTPCQKTSKEPSTNGKWGEIVMIADEIEERMAPY